jgi:hypothetical protein
MRERGREGRREGEGGERERKRERELHIITNTYGNPHTNPAAGTTTTLT